jgi:LmbE family N-acetylglucosaminyl deacetylase
VIDARRIAIVAAHPDDETVGLGGQLSRLSGLRIVHVTDGAPADMVDARRRGCTTREEYAALRQEELVDAMALAGLPPARLIPLGIADQEAAAVMAGLAQRLADLIDGGDIGCLITHGYEGGHPDHDAAAFAVQAATALLRSRGLPVPAVLEMAGYHADPIQGGLVTGRFLPAQGSMPETVLPLSAEARAQKRRLFAAFTSQAAVLDHFRVDEERLRPTLPTDFMAPPHPGRLWYERQPWGWTGESWRAKAAEAIAQLGLEAPPW